MVRTNLRRLAALLAALLTASLVAACGSGAPPSTGGSGGAFPLTIKGYLGTATIPKRPTRVIALANGDADAAIALGLDVIAVPKDVHAPDGVFPWLRGKVDPRRVTLLPSAAGRNLEQLASLHPDLILATNAKDISGAYAQMSRIAPVVTRPRAVFDQTWQSTTELIGKALGRADKVGPLIASVNAAIAADKAKYPTLNGATVGAAWVLAPGKILVIKDKTDVTVQFLGQLGMTVPGPLAANQGGSISQENIGLLNSDLMLVCYNTPDLQAPFEQSQLFTNIPAVRGGHYTPVSVEIMTQLKTPTVAGIPWLLDQLAPSFGKVAA